MRTRLALTAATGGLLLVLSGSALADPGTAPAPSGPSSTSGTEAPQYGPEWDPEPDQSGFEPEPDLSPFEPGYAPGTADLVDDTLGPVVTRLLGGLLGR